MWTDLEIYTPTQHFIREAAASLTAKSRKVYQISLKTRGTEVFLRNFQLQKNQVFVQQQHNEIMDHPWNNYALY